MNRRYARTLPLPPPDQRRTPTSISRIGFPSVSEDRRVKEKIERQGRGRNKKKRAKKRKGVM